MWALLERVHTGVGQVVDGAMVHGIAQLSHMQWSLRGAGEWTDEREANLLDGGAPFYAIYRCADNRHLAVGAIEPQFYAALLAGLGLDADDLPSQDDRSRWPELRLIIGDRIAAKTRDEWARIFEGTDACATPVLSMDEAPRHPRSATDPPPLPIEMVAIETALSRWGKS